MNITNTCSTFTKKSNNTNKRLVLIYGNCHATAIREMLESCPKFKEKYVVHPIKPIQEVTDSSYFDSDIFKECDVFIHQSIQTNNRYGPEFSSESIIRKLKNDCVVISVPNLYHLPMCYFPQYYEGVELKRLNGSTVFFRDSIIDNLFCSGENIKSIVNSYKNDSYYEEDHLSELTELFYKKVLEREKDWDIKIFDFLKNNENKRLFYDPNHPTSIIITYIAIEVMKMLDVKINENDIELLKSTNLDTYEMPFCASTTKYYGVDYHINNLEMRFTGNVLVKCKMDLYWYVREYVSLLWRDSKLLPIYRLRSFLYYILDGFVDFCFRIKRLFID